MPTFALIVAVWVALNILAAWKLKGIFYRVHIAFWVILITLEKALRPSAHSDDYVIIAILNILASMESGFHPRNYSEPRGQRGIFPFIRDISIQAGVGLHQLFENIYKRELGHYPVFCYIAGNDAILVRDASQIKQILDIEMEPVARAKLVYPLRRTLGINLVTALPHEAIPMRNRTLPYLTGQKLRDYEANSMRPIMDTVMVPTWRQYAAEKRPLNIWDSMLEYSSLIVFMSFLGLRENEISRHIHENLNKMFGLVRKLMLSAQPLPLWVPTPSNLDFKKRMSVVREFIRPFIQKQWNVDTMLGSMIRNYTTRSQRRTFSEWIQFQNKGLYNGLSSFEPTTAEAFSSAMKEANIYRQAQALCRTLESDKLILGINKQLLTECFLIEGGTVDEESVYQEIISNLIGGSETTIVFMTFACYHLATNPQVQEDLRDYLRSNEKCSLEELISIKNGYFANFLDEVLRLSPPGVVHNHPIEGSLELKQSDMALGCTIPEGCTPWMSIVKVHRDYAFWGRSGGSGDSLAMKFDPNRHLQKPIAGSYFPFGIGGRSCPGNWYAKREAAVAIAAMVSNFRVLPADPNYKLVCEYDTTMRPKRPFLVSLTSL